MTVAAQAGPVLDELIQRQQALLAELREVEHWRRLVAARLDLAIAAVTDIDDLSRHALPSAPQAPEALRELLGIPLQVDAQPDVSVLIPLRHVLADLDGYGRALRDATDAVTRALVARLEPSSQPVVVSLRPDTGPRRARTARSRSATGPADSGSRASRFGLPGAPSGEEAG